MAGSIDNQQIRKIYAIGNALGIVERGNEDDNLHSLVAALTGKTSVKSLTYSEAQAVIADLQRRQGRSTPPRQRKAAAHEERPGGATEGQQRKVWALMYQLEKKDTVPSTASLGERLCGIIRKELKVDAQPSRPFAWLDFRTCNRLIEVLKKYVANVKGSTGGDGE